MKFKNTRAQMFYLSDDIKKKCYLFCLFGASRRINPCGSLASDGIKLNMMRMERVKMCKIK